MELMPRTAPSPRDRFLGAELKERRTRARMTLTEAAGLLGWTGAHLSRTENGKRKILTEDVAALCAIYAVTGKERDRLVELSRSDDEHGWWHSLTGLPSEAATLASYEAVAHTLVSWGPSLLPGLTQTIAYARAFMLADGLGPEGLEVRLTARLRRQEVLKRPDVRYVALIGEAALRARVGGPVVMAEQLGHLVQLTQRPNITIRVVPIEVPAHPGMVGSFYLLDGPQRMVHIENARSGGFWDDGQTTAWYADATERITAISLSGTESVRLITRLAHERVEGDD